MVRAFGRNIEVVTERQCQRSAEDHLKLIHEARLDRQKRGRDVDESYVLCLRCGKALSLKI